MRQAPSPEVLAKGQLALAEYRRNQAAVAAPVVGTAAAFSVPTFNLELTQKEFLLLLKGIGKTSVEGRMDIGMSEEESRFFSDLYTVISKEKPNQEQNGY